MTTAELAAAARELVTRSCADQGIPETLTDPTALRAVAGIVARRDTGAPTKGPDASFPTFAAASPRGGRRGPS